MRKRIRVIDKIDVSLIYIQENIPNRDRQKVEMTQGYIDLLVSIMNSKEGLIHPITVRADHNGKYELFAGYRRFLVYENLSSEEVKYKRILANIWPPETSDEEMLFKTINENEARVDLGSIESLESKISVLPFVLGCGLKGNAKKNKEMGYEILRLYNSFLRGDVKNGSEKLNEIIKYTGCENAYEKLDVFFKGIGERVRTFYDKVSVLIHASPEILDLLYNKRISLRHAKALRTMKSNTDRERFVEKVKIERIPYKELDELIRESNIRNNPLKKRDALVKYAKNISVMLGDKKKDLTEYEHKHIKAHLQEIKEILLGER